jgi:hypothetical protein
MARILDLSKLLTDSGKQPGASYGKFVLISDEDENWLVIGLPQKFPYHAMLVEAFCNRRKIPYHWEQRPDIVRIDRRFTVINGGGVFGLNREDRTLTLGGESKAYGPVDRDDLEELTAGVEGLGGIRVVIEEP